MILGQDTNNGASFCRTSACMLSFTAAEMQSFQGTTCEKNVVSDMEPRKTCSSWPLVDKAQNKFYDKTFPQEKTFDICPIFVDM